MAKTTGNFEIEPRDQERFTLHLARFFPSKIKEIIKKVLEDKLSDSEFDPDSIHMQCEDCTKAIRNKCKSGEFRVFTKK